ncbi:hypothetical protein Nhal_1159 [Nitrosococcus halophilus Nc 4]|uniref:Uncharacterized protein n=1 Tax=Nitrosococcus halophilus (strain Nc4) TaxID=472759 RepID=D5BZN0_NITHN|nr:hypothetical protein Nhal_1159 [Nitrosococcus halophilus Nc 4]
MERREGELKITMGVQNSRPPLGDLKIGQYEMVEGVE